MQRAIHLLACFLICVYCFAQQYPFVHYTPKDGLISNQVRNIYQDSYGRLYFATLNGLSVYDGSRFINYTTKNGLTYDIVNCVMEMGDDSIWIVTNTSRIDCLVHGKLKTVNLRDPVPVINNIAKGDNGMIYAAAEQGLYFLDHDHFAKLPFSDPKGKDINFFLSYVISFGDYLLIQRDNALVGENRLVLYLYDRITKKVTDESEDITACNKSADGRIWVSTSKKIMSIDTNELKKGKLLLNELPGKFDKIKNLGNYFVLFDNEKNCWLGNQNDVIIRISSEGIVTPFTKASGLGFMFINHIFTDREGTIWIATNNAGVYKLVQSNFSIAEEPFGLSAVENISFDKDNERLLLFSSKKETLFIIKNNNLIEDLRINRGNKLQQVFETPHGIYGVGNNLIYKVSRSGTSLSPKIIFTDTTDQEYNGSLIDKNGNLFVCGRYILVGIIKKQGDDIINIKRLNAYTDHLASDSKGNIWLATRSNELIMFKTNPADPANYLEEKVDLLKIFPNISPRAITIDKNDNIWIGTRDHGIHVFKMNNGSLDHLFNINTEMGLSDKFTTQLACDADNNIWAASPAGLDKIIIKNGKPVIENITRQNNIYQRVFKIIIDNNNTTWALLSNGLLKVTKENKKNTEYTPSLMVTMVKAGKDTITSSTERILSHKQNNLNFYFSATSFINEKQIMYSYRLLGGTNEQWSESSNNATVSFIALPPGNYTLDVKAIFPANRYPDHIISYKFSIAPPWWGTWWFRALSGLLIIGLLIMAFRYYYRRKLERQLAALEKQQAIEKERTRIATDMHDDLGAGLSRIKFLSETIGIKKQQQQSIDEEVSSIRNYSHEMIDKMGEIVWALNEKNDTLSDLLSYTRAYVAEYLTQNGIEGKIEISENRPVTFVSGEFRRNIFLTIKEALHNVVKHSQATQVCLTISVNHQLKIRLQDNGTGFDKNNVRLFSNGLTNMETRIKEIGGKIEIANKNGTLIDLSIPLN